MWYAFLPLRYAAPLSSSQGTSSFMAVEINFQAFMFGPWSAPPINVVNTLSKRYPLLDGDDDDFEMATTTTL